MKKPLIVITGPTASGKTALSVALAKKIGGEIISGDSMQVYKDMDIGTAKVRKEEKQGIPHYMIDEFLPSQECSVAVFQRKVKQYMNRIYEKGNIPIIVGGTGFYIRSITHDIQFEELTPNTDYRDKLTEQGNLYGPEFLHKQLQELDPVTADKTHMNNMQRVIRALEYYHQSGEPISVHNEREKQRKTPYNLVFFGLTMDRSLLYDRINDRVDQMLAQGLLEEIESLLAEGYSKDSPGMKAIGYKEFFPYFEKTSPIETCISKLKQNTRHYAKRQLTWLKHQVDPIWVPVDSYDFNLENILEFMLNQLEGSNVIR